MNSTLALLREEGRVEGRIEGRVEGKVAGSEFSDLLNGVTIILSLFTSINDFSIQQIAIVTKRKKLFVQTVLQGFKGGNKVKAQKMLSVLFKNFEMGDFEENKIDALLKEYLPKFKK